LELEQATMPRRKSVEKKLRCETVMSAVFIGANLLARP
jgi:hypothetical protein